MPRIRTVDVRTQVLATARDDELQVAAGANTRIARHEQPALAADLSSAVDEVRRSSPGKSVHVAQAEAVLAEQLDAAIAAVNQPNGAGKPLLSRAEVQTLTARDPLLGGRVQRAIDLLAGPALPAPIRAAGADVHAQLTALLPGFYFDGLMGSEGGEPVSAVHVQARLSSPPSGEELARALGHDPSTDEGFVERYAAPTRELLQEWLGQQQAAQKDVQQVSALLRGLKDLRVLVVGKDGGANVDANHPTYIVGAAADGVTVGVRTGVIWT